jgi:hypothetical protein
MMWAFCCGVVRRKGDGAPYVPDFAEDGVLLI